MTYKEFYIWLDGFMTNRCWTTIKQSDIETIQEKMTNVGDDDSLDLSKIHITKREYSPFKPIVLPLNGDENDDLGKPPKIVM